MKRILQLNKKEIKVWFLTYIIVLIIPLIVNYFLFMHSKEIIDEEINSSRTALISSLKRDIDDELFSLKQTGVLMGQDQKTLKLISDDKKGLTNQNKYDIIEYLEYMEVVLGSLNGKYVMLHLNNVDGILFNGTYSESSFFYDNYLNSDSFPDFTSWNQFIEGKYKNEYLSVGIETTMGSEEQFIAYASSLPFGSLKSTSATLLTLVDQRRLLNILNEYKLSENGIVFIIDDKNRIVLSNSEDINIDTLDYNQLIPGVQGQYGIRNEKEVALIVEASDNVAWKFVVVSEKEVYLAKNNNYNRIVALSVIVYVGIGLLLALWFSSRNYKPIGQMVQMVSNHASDEMKSVDGGYDYLKSAFEQAFFKMDALENRIMEQNNVMRSNFLFRLLSGIVKDPDVIDDAMNKFNIRYDKSEFYTVIMNVGLRSSSESAPSISAYAKVAEYFRALPQLQEGSGYIIKDTYIIYIVNSDESNHLELQENLFMMVDQLKYEMMDLMTITISIGISNSHDSLSGLAEAYSESMNCLEYAMLYEPEEVLLYKDIVSKGAYYYPLSIEEKLINYMKSGNVEDAIKTLEEIYTRNFDESKIGINLGRNLLFDISSSMLKTMDTVAMNEMNLSRDIVHAVTYTKRIDETKSKLKESLREICQYHFEQNKSIEKISYHEVVNKYIDDHYKNPDLNISAIAEEFNLTPSYLSKLYKTESGESILNYINKVRVDEAKRLLRESDLTNSEVAISIGILNDTSFNRVFKNMEGITPGKYRKTRGL